MSSPVQHTLACAHMKEASRVFAAHAGECTLTATTSRAPITVGSGRPSGPSSGFLVAAGSPLVCPIRRGCEGGWCAVAACAPARPLPTKPAATAEPMGWLPLLGPAHAHTKHARGVKRHVHERVHACIKCVQGRTHERALVPCTRANVCVWVCARVGCYCLILHTCTHAKKRACACACRDALAFGPVSPRSEPLRKVAPVGPCCHPQRLLHIEVWQHVPA